MNSDIEDTSFPFQKLVTITFMVVVISYIIYHLYGGNYGFKNYINRQNVMEQKKVDSKKMEDEIAAIKNKINKLQSNNLDSDLLDEEIRKNTGYAQKNEIVIYSDSLLER